MKKYDFEAGEVLVFDKPLNWTSFNLVKIVRNNLSRRLGVKKLKVGHAGTLDPLATGVMIVCTGKATKNIDQLQAGTKEYIATLRLGCTTASFDAEHPVDATYPTAHITREKVEQTLTRFLGSIMQIPPVYSACKVEGRRAFDYVRQGEEVELKAKELVIDEIELLDLHLPEQGLHSPHAPEIVSMAREGVRIKESLGRKQLLEDAEQPIAEEPVVVPVDVQKCPYMQIRVVCSKGTYIRALARDIGQALGSGAYLIGLRRTRVGNCSLADCHVPVEEVEQWAAQVDCEPAKPSN